jgi:hypothetical protein
VPVTINIKEQPALFHRFEAIWNPTIIVLDPEGHERYRWVGFLPADEFQAQLMMGLAKISLFKKQWTEAEPWLNRIVEQFPNTEPVPEAMFWAAGGRFKATGERQAVVDMAQAMAKRYPESGWAKRSSVWLPKTT